MSSPFSGSLSNKRKADLVEIGQALGISDLDGKISDLVKSIQGHLETNEATLAKSPRFKGLYVRSRSRHNGSSDSDDALGEAKEQVEHVVKKGRKSVNKAIERVSAIDPANIALPESPISLNRIAEVAETVQEAANTSLSVALAPTEHLPRDLVVRLRESSDVVLRFGHEQNRRLNHAVRTIQHHLSRPNHLVSAALAVELLFLLSHITQFYDRAVFFPPPGGETGTIAALLHSLFFWLPNFTLTFRFPEIRMLGPSSEVWPSVAWWLSTTVLPPLALSSIISYVPQRGQSTGHNTRHATSHPVRPTPDPLTFALIRFAILLYPLTTAAQSSFVDALEMSGNLEGRALGAGLLAALVLASRVTA